ncbi:MAG: transcriptional regulator NrdR [Microthrixaceae bacterium]
MRCPACGGLEDKVIDSRSAEEGSVIRRRRQCDSCSTRFTTLERIEAYGFHVIKRDARRVPYDRLKVESGVLAACKGRPVQAAAVAALADRLEEHLSSLKRDATADEVGQFVLSGLRELDQVAAVRFASVYKSFEDPQDFEREVKLLESEA